MTLAIAFWVIMIVAFVFGGAWYWRPEEPRWAHGAWFVLFVLVILLGCAVFGTPLHQ